MKRKKGGNKGERERVENTYWREKTIFSERFFFLFFFFFFFKRRSKRKKKKKKEREKKERKSLSLAR